MKILVVEDNQRLAKRIQEKLHSAYTIDSVDTGSQALSYASSTTYSVIILDLGLPDISGLEVCRKLRDTGNETPILVLTGTGQLLSKIELLDSGADDYIVKPVSFDEIRARVGALARRQKNRELVKNLLYKNIEIDLNLRKVYCSGTEIKLRRKEFEILYYLISNNGRIVTRQMIMDNVWSGESTSWITTIDVHIKHLRDKLDRPFGTKTIKTAYGIGYKVD